MYSIMAALRSLTLPYGTTTGTRIVLDGVNGRISLFDALNNEVIREDSATQTIAAGDADGTGARVVLDGANAYLRAYTALNVETIRLDAANSRITAGSMGTAARVVTDGANAKITGYDASNNPGATFDAATPFIGVDSASGSYGRFYISGGQAQMNIRPNTLGGTTWSNGSVLADYDPANANRPFLAMFAPIDSAAASRSIIAMYSGISGNDNSWVTFWTDMIYAYAELRLENSLPAMSGNTAGETQQIQFGTSVVTTNGTGQWTINTGLSPLRGFVAWNGDVGARPNMVIGNNRGNWPAGPGPNVSGTCYTGSTGATINNSACRIDWMAFGV